MLKELFREDKEAVSYSVGLRQLYKTRRILEKFLKGGKQRVVFGAPSETSRWLPVKIEGEDFNLKISTASLLRDWDDDRAITLSIYSKSKKVHWNSFLVPVPTLYSNMGDDERWPVDHFIRLMQKDVLPLVQKTLSKKTS